MEMAPREEGSERECAPGASAPRAGRLGGCVLGGTGGHEGAPASVRVVGWIVGLMARAWRHIHCGQGRRGSARLSCCLAAGKRSPAPAKRAADQRQRREGAGLCEQHPWPPATPPPRSAPPGVC